MRLHTLIAAASLLIACTGTVEEDVGEDASAFLFCFDNNPCTTDVLISGVAGNFCSFRPLPGGTTCTVGDCTGSCYPPRLEEDGSLTPGNCGGCPLP